MKVYRITHVTEAGTRVKLAQKWVVCRSARAQRFLRIRYRNYPITETRTEVAEITEDMWKEWTP